MMLFSRLRGLPVLTPGEGVRLGVVRALTVDAASGTVTHVRVRRGRLRGDAALAWDALDAVAPDMLIAAPSSVLAVAPPHHDLLGRRVLTEDGEERGTVLDAAFDPLTARIEAILTTIGELPAERLLGLGGHALVVRGRRTARDQGRSGRSLP
ncbi:PRC-barrel domain-containing protein [Streptomyces hirsutus]|uniref:PRC-barrel domain-containing protein n=2 Tax=Streptomyces TaxID=1883 RepID=A0ABZ1GFB8_9ACTN|nr:PRC-barrel domain-containing protein [Streptomyces hirsutus]WSD04807.1 PRC-barrel domain-containing protein [Streptomyces hirsutus]WTD21802.1 PRC-barrel domain-containing protein [Streptomyces hirsutus]WTD79186.1 PRC-barrel domain-containing protein [Streptomyces sp. NBC_01635]